MTSVSSTNSIKSSAAAGLGVFNANADEAAQDAGADPFAALLNAVSETSGSPTAPPDAKSPSTKTGSQDESDSAQQDAAMAAAINAAMANLLTPAPANAPAAPTFHIASGSIQKNLREEINSADGSSTSSTALFAGDATVDGNHIAANLTALKPQGGRASDGTKITAKNIPAAASVALNSGQNVPPQIDASADAFIVANSAAATKPIISQPNSNGASAQQPAPPSTITQEFIADAGLPTTQNKPQRVDLSPVLRRPISIAMHSQPSSDTPLTGDSVQTSFNATPTFADLASQNAPAKKNGDTILDARELQYAATVQPHEIARARSNAYDGTYNLFDLTIGSASAAPAQNLATAAGTPQFTLNEPIGTAAWNQSLGEHVVWLAGQELQQARLQLHPQDLGQIDIRLSIEHNQVVAAFTVQHTAAAAAIHEALPHLQNMLGQHGLALGQATVSHQDNSQPGGTPYQQTSAAFAAPALDNEDGGAVTARPRTPLGVVDDFA